VHIGFGKRSDFTKTLGVKADFSHDYDLMGSIKNQLEMKKRLGTQKEHTFGSPFKSCHKAVIPGAPHFSRVDASKTDHMGYEQLSAATAHTLKNHVRLPKMT
jgi:hypothetical protein